MREIIELSVGRSEGCSLELVEVECTRFSVR
jgi:hypothetical protein